jgi:hypothetical protein
MVSRVYKVRVLMSAATHWMLAAITATRLCIALHPPFLLIRPSQVLAANGLLTVLPRELVIVPGHLFVLRPAWIGRAHQMRAKVNHSMQQAISAAGESMRSRSCNHLEVIAEV